MFGFITLVNTRDKNILEGVGDNTHNYNENNDNNNNNDYNNDNNNHNNNCVFSKNLCVAGVHKRKSVNNPLMGCKQSIKSVMHGELSSLCC